MYHTSKGVFIFFISIVLILTACSGGTESQSQQSGSSDSISGTCDNPLLPVKQGAMWVYVSNGGPGGSFTYTDTVTSVLDGKFTITSQFADLIRTQEWACQSDGLKALQLGGGTAAGISTLGMTAAFTTIEINGISLPKEVTPGMQWAYSLKMQGTMAMPGDQQAQSSGVYSVTTQEIGRETITVPAGTFEAVKLQSNSTIDIVTSFEGIDVPIKFNGTTISWYVPGVGFVKSVENGDFGGTTFAATTELQSYNIP